MIYILSIILVIILFQILIAIHELGHLLAARACGVQVLAYNIGFGPVLWHSTVRGIECNIRAIPLGGSTDMLGEGEPKSCGTHSLGSVRPLQQCFILSAGALANILAAILIFATALPALGVRTSTVAESSCPELLPGDEICRIGDTDIRVASDIVLETDQDAVTVTVSRAGALRTVSVQTEGTGSDRTIPVTTAVSHSISDGVVFGVRSAYYSICDLFAGNSGTTKTATSLIGIAGLAAGMAGSPLKVIVLMAYVSIALALGNLVPIPPLDGYRILFTLLRAANVQVAEDTEQTINAMGTMVLLLLALILTVTDICKLI